MSNKHYMMVGCKEMLNKKHTDSCNCCWSLSWCFQHIQ